MLKKIAALIIVIVLVVVIGIFAAEIGRLDADGTNNLAGFIYDVTVADSAAAGKMYIEKTYLSAPLYIMNHNLMSVVIQTFDVDTGLYDSEEFTGMDTIVFRHLAYLTGSHAPIELGVDSAIANPLCTLVRHFTLDTIAMAWYRLETTLIDSLDVTGTGNDKNWLPCNIHYGLSGSK